MIFTAVLIFCTTPLIVGLWGFLRVGMVNPFVAAGVVERIKTWLESPGATGDTATSDRAGSLARSNPFLAGSESHAAKTPQQGSFAGGAGEYCSPDSLCGRTESDHATGIPATRHSLSEGRNV